MEAPAIEDARAEAPPCLPAHRAVLTFTLPRKLQRVRHYEELQRTLYGYARALEADYVFLSAHRDALVACGHADSAADVDVDVDADSELDADARSAAAPATMSASDVEREVRARCTGADEIERALEAYREHFRDTLRRGSRYTVARREFHMRFDLEIFMLEAAAALNAALPALAADETAAFTRCAHDYAYVRRHQLARARTPVLRFSASELTQHYAQLERHFATLPYDAELEAYVRALKVRCAMLLRCAHTADVFDVEQWRRAAPHRASAVSPSLALSSPTTTTTTTAPQLYVYSRRLLEDSCWFFGGVESRLYTRTLWRHCDAAASARALLPRAFELDERARRLASWLRTTGAAMSIEMVNETFRTQYLEHVLRPSELARYMRDYPHAQLSLTKMLKATRGLAGITALLEEADPNVGRALREADRALGIDVDDVAVAARTDNDGNDDDGDDAEPGSAPSVERAIHLDCVALDMLRIRVMDAYFRSFFQFSFEEQYVYYNADLVSEYRAIRNRTEPLIVQTFTRFDVLHEDVVYECASVAHALALWLALIATLARRRCGSTSIAPLYVAMWGRENDDFSACSDTNGTNNTINNTEPALTCGLAPLASTWHRKEDTHEVRHGERGARGERASDHRAIEAEHFRLQTMI